MLRFTDTRLERPRVRDKFDLLLGIVATFEVCLGERLLYHEEMFPVVELRVELAQWLSDAYRHRENFEFRSMESDEEGLLWLRRVDGGWRIGSIHQEYPEMQTLSDAEVSEFITNFIEDVDRWVHENCHVSISSFLLYVCSFAAEDAGAASLRFTQNTASATFRNGPFAGPTLAMSRGLCAAGPSSRPTCQSTSYLGAATRYS